MTNPANRWTQAPTEKRLYEITTNGDTISSATWRIVPSAGVTLAPQTPVASTTRCLVSGLKFGQTYALYVHLVGATGQEFDSDAAIACG